MRKLSEYKNEEAIELLADILEPVCEICADDEFQKSLSKSKMEIVQTCMKKHSKALLKIMAVLDGVPFEEYHVNILELPVKVLQLLNDEELMNFFHSQGQMISSVASGSAMENTQEKEPQEDSSVS